MVEATRSDPRVAFGELAYERQHPLVDAVDQSV